MLCSDNPLRGELLPLTEPHDFALGKALGSKGSTSLLGGTDESFFAHLGENASGKFESGYFLKSTLTPP